MALRWGICVLILALAGGCRSSGMAVLAIANHLAATGRYERVADLVYGPLPEQKLDVYTPRGQAAGPRPVVIFFHGGDWSENALNKDNHRFVAHALTSKGLIAVVVNYRRYPSVKFPAFVEDGAAAVAWTQQHMTRFGGDPQRLFLMGHSAGGHLAAMLALDPDYIHRAGGEPREVAGLIGVSGPYAFLPMPDEFPYLKDLFGPPDRYPLSQAVNYVDAHDPPMLLLAGEQDHRVPLACTLALRDRAEQAGGQVRMIIYDNAGHIMMLGSLAAPVRWFRPAIINDIARFVQDVGDASGQPFNDVGVAKLPEPPARKGEGGG